MVVWGAHVYALKDKFLTGWKHLMVPVMVVFGAMVLLDIAVGDLGTAMVMLATGLVVKGFADGNYSFETTASIDR